MNDNRSLPAAPGFDSLSNAEFEVQRDLAETTAAAAVRQCDDIEANIIGPLLASIASGKVLNERSKRNIVGLLTDALCFHRTFIGAHRAMALCVETAWAVAAANRASHATELRNLVGAIERQFGTKLVYGAEVSKIIERLKSPERKAEASNTANELGHENSDERTIN